MRMKLKSRDQAPKMTIERISNVFCTYSILDGLKTEA